VALREGVVTAAAFASDIGLADSASATWLRLRDPASMRTCGRWQHPVVVASRSMTQIAHAIEPSSQKTVRALEVVNLAELPIPRRNMVISRLSAVFHEVWRHCTDEFESPSSAEHFLHQRVESREQVCFVALADDGDVAGTGSVANDDFYEGFSLSNGVAPGYVGRDLWTAERWRGVVINGLKVWEHLLRARLRWVEQRGGAHLTVFTEPGPLALTALYGRLGAIVLRSGLDHRTLGLGCITMLGYPVREVLSRLDERSRQRAAELAPASDLRLSSASVRRPVVRNGRRLLTAASVVFDAARPKIIS
jgi:hypothetical protein